MDCCCGLLNSFLKCPFKFNMNVDDDVRFTMCPTRNKRILVDKIRLLKAMKKDVERETERNDATMQVKHEVSAWLQRVEQLFKDVEPILTTNRDSPSHRCTCSGLCSNYDVGLNIKQSIEIAKILEEEKRKWEGALFVPKSLIRLTSSLPENVVGIDEMTSEILSFLNNNEEGGDIVGIYGMGGAGKTTLAKNVINELQSAESNCFEKIILVGVSQKNSITDIQEQIAAQLGCSVSLPKKEIARANIISEKLSQMSFLLVLDDVWEKIDLTKIGITKNDRDSRCRWKVLLTTRDENVCKAMGARKMLPVLLLKERDSWDLFRRTIDKDDIILSGGIHELAKEMVDKCRGLPLVLVTIARSMATKTRFDEWAHAVDEFKNRPHEIRGMEDVYELLKFSYDNLKSRDHQTFLRHVTLFPEYYDIDIDRIIDYWIGGMAFDSGYQPNIDTLRSRGKDVVSDLIGACLLERGSEDRYLKVHDAIYDMIIWRGQRGYSPKILTHVDREELIVDETWKDMDMVSLTGNRIKKVIVQGNIKQFTSIRVLLIGGNLLHSKHLNRLLYLLPSLRVLDFSGSDNVRKFPKSICSFQSLQYLKMMGTDIKTLPIEMENLKNLMYLNLRYVNRLSFIPKGLLSSLSKLQFLSLPNNRLSMGAIPEHQSPFQCCRKSKVLKVHIKDLEELPRLRDLDGLFALRNDDDLRNLLESDVPIKCLKVLVIYHVDLTIDDVDTMSSRMEKLKKLCINQCLNKLHELFLKGRLASLERLLIYEESCLQRIVVNNEILCLNLTNLGLYSCPKLQDLSCLWQLPNLEYFSLYDCGKIREILLPQSNDQTTNSAPLSMLQHLSLNNMQALERISSSPLPLPSLGQLDIKDCPLLRKLSIKKSSFENINITCEKEWWDSLEWDNGIPLPKRIEYWSYRQACGF